MFPLKERTDFLPPEMQAFTIFVTQVLLTAPVLPKGDAPSTAPIPVEELLTPENRVARFLALLGEILDDPDSSKLLRERIGQISGLR